MKRLLIVDDEPKICQVLSRFFQLRGFHTLTAQSGTEAMDRLRGEAPDYLLLDLCMPGLSGLEVLKLARSLHPQLRVVVISALEDRSTMLEAFRLGAYDYVPKPLTTDDRVWARAFFAGSV